MAGGEGPVRVPAERIDELMDLASELITRRGLWAAQADTMKDFASMARTCRGRLMGSIDRLRDLRPHRQPAASGGTPGRDRLDHHADLPELIHRLAEQADDLVVLAEAAQASSKPLSDNSESLARLTLQLWESLQAIRIVPVRGLFQRLARVAHDAARVEDRQVEVVMVGEETGLDKAVQDKAFEPLLHVVRNAVCHGIEPSQQRHGAGKPATGRITIEAARAGNTLVLSVQDDGRGLDYQAIAAKGRRLGLLDPDDNPGVERLNALVFQSGFSTREEATAIAGRGVGMDVVSQEVGRLHGSVVLESQTGQGTRLSISLPARLALQQAMVLRIDGQAFALPVELIELVQPFDSEDVDRSGPCPKVRVREQWVPLVVAREALRLSTGAAVSCPKLLLIRAEGGTLAVLVDSIDGTKELVIKPLGTLLQGHPVVSGASLSVTGEVIFSLNPAGLARLVGGGGERGGLAPGRLAQPQPRVAPILVVDDSISVRKVVARNLRSLGYEVEEVSDGLEALGKLRNHTYALVLSDLEMPRMDGFELLAELNRLEIAREVPVVMASTRSDPETRRRVLGLGARQFIPKPIEPDVLAAMVQELLRIREAPAMRTPEGFVEEGTLEVPTCRRVR
jgi:chemotaxis protein histidine kinase CheA/ActR/RegA family two-component response regulator